MNTAASCSARKCFLLFFFAFVVDSSLPAVSCAEDHESGHISRRVLCLYDSSELPRGNADQSNAHLYLGMPLNRLGMALDYHDVQKRPLPDLNPYRAVAIWLNDNRMIAPQEYAQWLEDGLAQGVRLICFDGLGADADAEGRMVGLARSARVMRLFGLEDREEIPSTNNPFVLREVSHDKKAFQFEVKSPPERLSFQGIKSILNDVKVWQEIIRTDMDGAKSVTVCTSPRGGWVSEFEYAIQTFEKPEWRVRWDLNPFLFLEESLDCRTWPRPDVTTVCGARAAFSHIDGDGQANGLQDVPPVKALPSVAASVVYAEVLSKYPVPVTVGLIASEVDPEAVGKKELLPLWRKILSLPNVQPSAHGYSHPFDWVGKTAGVKIPGYEVSYRQETIGALEIVRRLVLQNEEKPGVFLWTGDCAPPAEALKHLAEYGALNLNGGDPRYDGTHESVTNLCPLVRPVGEYTQVYAAACNEYVYSGNWRSNFGGFRNVLETFKRCDSPRYLPVNIYYHFYSGERLAGLKALKDVYDWALKQTLCWIHAEEYAQMVLDSRNVRIGKSDDGGWWVSDYGTCRTVRFDDTTKNVDMTRSQHVWGFTHHAGSLYVTLAPEKRAVVYMSDERAQRPCLSSSTSLLRNVRFDSTEREWGAQARLYAAGAIEVQGFVPGAKCHARVGEKTSPLIANETGLVRIPMPAGRGEWVEVRLGY